MSMLSGYDIISAIRRHGDKATREAFDDVYSIDKLPFAIPHYPFFMIVNMQTHNLPGSHWIAIYVSRERRGEIFDSLALAPPQVIMRWLHQFTRSVTRNSLSYQHPLSDTCGAFALYFVLHRLKGPVTFTPSLYKNENIVRTFYSNLK